MDTKLNGLPPVNPHTAHSSTETEIAAVGQGPTEHDHTNATQGSMIPPGEISDELTQQQVESQMRDANSLEEDQPLSGKVARLKNGIEQKIEKTKSQEQLGLNTGKPPVEPEANPTVYIQMPKYSDMSFGQKFKHLIMSLGGTAADCVIFIFAFLTELFNLMLRRNQPGISNSNAKKTE